MAFENTNAEINDDQKQLFAEAVERLEPFTVIDTPNLIDEPEDEVVILEKGGSFRLNGADFYIESVEVIGYDGERKAKGQSVTAFAEVAIGDLILARTTIYCADWYSGCMEWHEEDYPYWKTEYGSEDTQQVQSAKERAAIPDDYEREIKAFYAELPNACDIRARREEIAQEEGECESGSLLAYRFTKAKFKQIMPLLNQINAEHFMRPSKS